MVGTFYVNSANLDTPGRLTSADLHAFVSQGNEIGGHTVDHAYLPSESPAEQMREVCDDRLTLTKLGLQVTDFAYPYGASNAVTTSVVQQCGYNSARQPVA